MEADELKKIIMDEKKSGNFTLQSIFNRNIENIERLKQKGYTYKSLNNLVCPDIAFSHFENLVYRAKNKNKTTLNKPSNDNKSSVIKATSKVSSEVATVKLENYGDIDLTQWADLGIVNQHHIKMLTKYDIKPENVKSWEYANDMELTRLINSHKPRDD